MKIADICQMLNQLAPPSLAEGYDNVGLQVGQADAPCAGVLVSLDVTPEVLAEALALGANLVVSHHPVWFGTRHNLSGNDMATKVLLQAIASNVALYAIHTNLDNVAWGVNRVLAEKLGLQDLRILAPKANTLSLLSLEVPPSHLRAVEQGLFAVGCGQVGGYYDQCSMHWPITDNFRPLAGAQPYVGVVGQRSTLGEVMLQVLVPNHLTSIALKEMIQVHPYEEVAYQLIPLANSNSQYGAGMLGQLPEKLSQEQFLTLVSQALGAKGIRYAPKSSGYIQRVAVCGGSGSFLINNAIAAGADAFITADISYHNYFLPQGHMMLLDVGHWESEQYTSSYLVEQLLQKFPNFAVHLAQTATNPVRYHA